MCGIAVLLRSEGGGPETLRRMNEAVVHRGPDDGGEVFLAPGSNGAWKTVGAEDPAARLGLGHRRLSILDLSTLGHQPMCYRGRYWTVFNGEIYNYRELGAELKRKGHEFVSTSDTEVLLAAFAEWGTACFERFRGMWAVVLVDVVARRIVYSRDRLGIKPLYRWSRPGTLALVSEIKQLLCVPGFVPRLDAGQGAEFLATGYELTNRTFFQDVTPVQPGTFAEIDLDTGRSNESRSYWSPERVQVIISDAAEAAEIFWSKFEESVRLHLRSDVTVGCALSGGLDSSSIAAAVMRGTGGRPDSRLQTFSLSFPGSSVDETEHVRTVAAATAADSRLVEPRPAGFLDDLEAFTWAHDEPVGGLSVYAGYAVARLTHEAGIKVTLNGQGGDEILAGYWQQYLLFLWNAARSMKLGLVVRHLGGSLGPKGNPAILGQIPRMLGRLAAKRRHGLSRGGRSRFLTEMIGEGRETLRLRQFRELMIPRLLKWEDRNSMAFGVEGRYPFLDHELIETCLGFDDRILYSAGWVKWPLRLALDGKLPASIVWRRDKKGFEVPASAWFSGSLGERVASWLEEDRPVWELVDREAVRKRVAESSGPGWRRIAGAEEVFRCFALDAWLERFAMVMP